MIEQAVAPEGPAEEHPAEKKGKIDEEVEEQLIDILAFEDDHHELLNLDLAAPSHEETQEKVES